MSVTKIVVRRTLGTKRGHFTCELTSLVETPLDEAEGAEAGMTIKESRIAHTLLAYEAELGALRAALLDGAVSATTFQERKNVVETNTLAILSRSMPQAEAQEAIEAADAA